MTDKKRVTRKEVAERAGVSVAVVSYVVNNGPRPVSPETQAKVQQAIDELGYYPNELARSLSRQRTATIGLIIPSLLNPVFAEIAESLESACASEGYLVILGGTGRDLRKEVEFAKLLRAKQIDGVVVLPNESPQAIIEPLQQASIPVVVLEHDLPNTHCITMDELQGARLAMQHLLSLGHRRIGMIKRQPSSALSNLRFVGYTDNLIEAGIPYDPALVIESKAGHAAGYTSMRQLLALPNPPTAVFTHNDMLAMGAIRAIHDAGLTVPGDISVVGYDDTSNAAYLNPRLTTVKSPVAELGQRASQIIMELAQHAGNLPAQTIILPVELIVRASTAPPPENLK
ncbi:MAG: LacI family DNA-binding transcriptional regulator [Anaerolineaceae bacterium]|nr:LacI family DNA-binding transcriptional regulator [Anaerolineaceae bacterium]